MRPALPWFLKSTSSWQGFTPGQAAVYCLPFLVMGVASLWALILRPALDWKRSRDWEPTKAVMERAWVEIIHGTRGSRTHGSRTHKVAVQFRYKYQGMAYLGTRHSFIRSVGAGQAQKVVNSLPAGKTVTCWVNPDHPDEAVLDRSWPLQTGWGLFFSTPFIIVGLGLGVLVLPWPQRWFFARRQAQMAELVATGKLPKWVLKPLARLSDPRTDNIALIIASDNRLTQALASTCFALFWNGITGTFVWCGLAAVMDGDQTGAIVFFLILSPFVAGGIFIFWMALRSWRLLRRPQWVAAMRPPPGSGGGTVAFCWTWLDDARLPHPPQAQVRIVAQAALWHKESYGLSPGTGGKLRWKLANPAAARRGQVELVAVEVPLQDAAKEIRVKLPPMPAPPTQTTRWPRWMPTATWGVWWQLEVTYPDGMIELADLTEAEKFP